MNAEQDWSRWQATWHRHVPVDVEHLARRARRKRWQMMAVMLGEWLIALIAIAQTVQLVMLDSVAMRWKVWGVIMMALVAVSAWFSWRLRQGTWILAASQNVDTLLDLSARRARAGIRLARFNIVGIIVFVVISAVLALPWLVDSDWLHHPRLRLQVELIVAVNTPVVIVTIIYGCFYMRRQQRRLRRIRQVQAESSGTGD